jgi:hypothetical protein
MINKRMDFIDAKTDILYLSIVSNQVSTVLNDGNQRIWAIHEQLKSKEFAELKADDPKKDALNKQFSRLRSQNEVMSVTFDSLNLALNKLIIALTPGMEERHPTLKGSIDNEKVNVVKKKKEMTGDDLHGQASKQEMPPVRPATETQKGA